MVERRPNGGLLMAATDATFDVDNPAHMAVARDIERAGAPLSGTPPWELGASRHDRRSKFDDIRVLKFHSERRAHERSPP